MRVGIIGAGWWAMQTHLPALQQIEGVVVSGVWARRAGAASAAVEGTGVPGLDDLDELLRRSDAVSIAVTPAAQADLAIRAARAGCDVIFEKPLAEDEEKAADVARVVEERGVRAIVFATREWDATRRVAMDNLAGSGVGARMEYRWRSRGMLATAGTWRRTAGALIDVGPHMLPVMERIAGPLVGVQWAEMPVESVIRAELVHEGGGTSVLDVDLAADVPFTREEILVESTDGRRRWENTAAVDFIAAYAEMFGAFERIRAGTATRDDFARGALASQLRASHWIERLGEATH
jgi:predicted dehydrogenase